MTRSLLGASAAIASLLLAGLAARPVGAWQDFEEAPRAASAPPEIHVAVLPLVEDLANGDTHARIAATMALRELGPKALPALPLLIDALDDPLVPVRKGAAGALGGIGAEAAPAVPALREALGDPHRFVRSWVAMALFEIGPGARAAGPDLAALLRSDAENLRGRAWAASALPRLDVEPDVAVPALREALLEDPSDEVRSVAALSLQEYGPRAARRGAAMALREALSDPHWKVRGNAACALPAMGEEAEVAISHLVSRLRDATPYVRGCAARSVGELARLTRSYLHELAPLVEDDDAHVRSKAIRALALLRAVGPAPRTP